MLSDRKTPYYSLKLFLNIVFAFNVIKYQNNGCDIKWVVIKNLSWLRNTYIHTLESWQEAAFICWLHFF